MLAQPEELRRARLYLETAPFEGLSREQAHRIVERGRELYHWYKNHHRLHCLINAAVLTLLLTADFYVLLRLPYFWLGGEGAEPLVRQLLVALIVGSLHAWIMYSLGVLSLHEGAAHHGVFPPKGPISRIGDVIANNICRIGSADPVYYGTRHMIHHSKFGTEQDEEFLNFITPRRYWLTFVPLAMALNFSDFISHRPLTYTSSRVLSLLCTCAYQGTYAYFMYRAWGIWVTVVVMLVFMHVAFYLDRIRQFTEHNLMPLDNWNGSRSLGIGFWGTLLGGGPWGNPYHWEHHIVPSIPWYQLLILHRFSVRLLTPQQRKQFFLQPVVGFPRLWWRLIRDSNAVIAASSRPTATHQTLS